MIFGGEVLRMTRIVLRRTQVTRAHHAICANKWPPPPPTPVLSPSARSSAYTACNRARCSMIGWAPFSVRQYRRRPLPGAREL